VIPAVLLLVAAVFVERRAQHPVVPINIITQKVPALAIVASLAVGMAMYGGAVFLGQYFQTARGYSPTEAGLLTIPMMFGMLASSTVVGRLITRSGKVKPYIVAGAISLAVGLFQLSFMDHNTPLWSMSIGMLFTGIGVGMTMQNLVLAVQNKVALRDLGAASGAVTFFRSLGGTMGVAVLGAVLANQVTANTTQNLTNAGINVPAGSSGSSLDISALPGPIAAIVRTSFGDSVGPIFLISALIALVGIVAAVLLPKVVLRHSLDLAETGDSAAAGQAAKTTPARTGGTSGPRSGSTAHRPPNGPNRVVRAASTERR